ncbi:hypothetical protein CSB93_1640 [Pseudomonas paraeruginosa]|uniref:Uncharacterized protein n=1 Tax=Pseudomonas paraeruginosa TaxID=2994495 RepID=A0A2R3IWH7_9PSED|nr:hypothetical protein CSB93_1640 [Pseudomonas paraeruginosa]
MHLSYGRPLTVAALLLAVEYALRGVSALAARAVHAGALA